MSGEKKKEKKTYYCPFDLEPIDMNNLAYELAFNENFTYLEAQNDKNFIALTTVDGGSVIELSAERRKEIFGYCGNAASHRHTDCLRRRCDGPIGVRSAVSRLRIVIFDLFRLRTAARLGKYAGGRVGVSDHIFPDLADPDRGCRFSCLFGRNRHAGNIPFIYEKIRLFVYHSVQRLLFWIFA